MKNILICLSTAKGGMEDQVHPLFGRAPTFTFVTVTDGKPTKAETVTNDFSGASGGAGVQAAQLIIQKKGDAIISGRFGPHAYEALKAAGIRMAAVSGITVKDAVNGYLNGTIKPIE